MKLRTPRDNVAKKDTTMPASRAEGILKLSSVGMDFDRPNKHGQLHVLSDINLELDRFSFTSIIGPSGCGKSTLLKLCCGLEEPTHGSVLFESRLVSSVNTAVGYVSQDDTLLPWANVLTNVTLPLRLRGVAKHERIEKGRELLALVGLTGFERYYPAQLSGGMQKRCIIARAISYEPSLFLMDEPFGPLDALTKLTLQQQLVELFEQRHVTTLFVTHDLNEAIALSDRVIAMGRNPGRVKYDVRIPLGRPRNVSEIQALTEFQTIREKLWRALEDELAEADQSVVTQAEEQE